MRWLDNLMGWKNVTYEWVADKSRPVVYDFDEHRFCGVRVGGGIDGLAHLGPSDNKNAPDPAVLSYKALGLDVLYDEEEQRMEGVVFAFDDATLGTYTGIFRWQGRTVSLGRQTTEPGFIAIFGEAYAREAETDIDTVLYYEWPGVEMQAAFENGRLASLEISMYPELASAEVRQMLGVTKPWTF
jgi:hypothetical protein